MRAADLQPLIDSVDDSGLLQGIDQLCALQAWDELVDLLRRCDEAAEFGRQLWGVRQHVEYRLALEAPPAWAGPVVRPGAARFGLGPLSEVVGERFAWREIAEHLPDRVGAVTVAGERTLRGEDLQAEPVADEADLPLTLASFEPTGYPRPIYHAREAKFPAPAEPTLQQADAWGEAPAGARSPADDGVAALEAVAAGWFVGEPDPQAVNEAARVAGEASDAVGALAPAAPVRAARCSAEAALQWLQWAGASGGAFGRRRGGAAGRFLAWSALAAVAGLAWPARVEAGFVADLADAADELRWWRWWRDDRPDTGWVVRLAVEDPLDGLAYAVQAVDPPPEEREL